MANLDEAGKKKTVSMKTVLIAVIVALSVIASAYAMVTVSRTFDAFEMRPSDFVTLPATPVSKTGEDVVLDSVATTTQGNLAVGVQGYLETTSGQPVSGANVYAQYYFEGAYRTQVATTDQNGYFEIHFPMNWTGWLQLTITYFGDGQHQGLQQAFSLQGESL
jgi:flagellar basal body-associated protein FliL